jgi:8-oxo-dGTP pyrophosphatase MutT (NUDIX family)
MLGPDALAEALAARPWVDHPALPGRTNHLRAGVLVPLRFGEGRVDAVATLRPDHLRRHAGEVSFPGGRPEDVDPDLTATALREAREELGLADARVLGRLSSMPVYTSDWRLEPFVAVIGDAPLAPDPGEVAEVLAVDLVDVLRRGVVEAIGARHEGATLLMPVFRPGGHVMFGATALVLWELVGVAAEVAGVEPPELVPGDLTWERLMAHRARAGVAGKASAPG